MHRNTVQAPLYRVLLHSTVKSALLNVLLCCVVLCCVVLCCVALRCVVLRCVVLRCVVLVLSWIRCWHSQPFTQPFQDYLKWVNNLIINILISVYKLEESYSQILNFSQYIDSAEK